MLVFHPSPVATRFYDKASILLPRPCRFPAQLPVSPHEYATAGPLCRFPAPCYMQIPAGWLAGWLLFQRR